MNLRTGADFDKDSQENNLAAVRAVIWVIAVVIEVAIVSEIDPVRAIGAHRPEVKGRDTSRSVGGEHDLGAIGTVGRVKIVNRRIISDIRQSGTVDVHDEDLTSRPGRSIHSPVKDDLGSIRAKMRSSASVGCEGSESVSRLFHRR